MSTKFYVISILILFSKCTFTKTETNKYLQYIKPELKEYIKDTFNGKILSLANDACQKCAYWMLENYKNLNCNSILYFDTTIYGNIAKKDSCHKIIGTNNDIISRINYPNINGHRIYWIANNEILKVKEINAKNADSVFYYLKD